MTPARKPRHGGAFPMLRYMPRNQVITIRVTQETADAIDAVRAGESRARWVAQLIADALNTTPRPVSPYGQEIRPETASRTCDHPRARVIKGFCYKCGSMVLPK